MHCPGTISLFLLGVFLMFQPSSQDIPGPLFSPRILGPASTLKIICSGKQLFGPVAHDPSLEPYEVSIMKLNEHVYSNERPLLKYTAFPSRPEANSKTSAESVRRVIIIDTSKKVDEYALILTIDTTCHDYGLYQCSMKLPNANLSPKYKVFHQSFYVDHIDNIPKLMLMNKITSFVRGQKINITCEQTSREKRMGMALFYRPLTYYKYYPLNAEKAVSFSEYRGGMCAGYYRRHLSVILSMDERIWDSEIVCVANRSNVHVVELNQDLSHDLMSNPVTLSSRGGKAECASTIITARHGTDHIVDKATTISYSPLLAFSLASLAVFSIMFPRMYK